MGDAEFIEILKVARKIQVVDAVQFSKPPQMWAIAHWMKAHRVDSTINGVTFSYHFQNEKKELFVKRNEWIVKDEAGFASFTETDFQKKFVIDRRGDGDPTPGA